MNRNKLGRVIVAAVFAGATVAPAFASHAARASAQRG